MDNIFWGVYLADIVGTIKGTAFVLICVSTLILWLLIGLKTDNIHVPRWQFITASIVLVVSVIINIVVPSKETMYAMVASEAVGHAIDSDIVNKAIHSIDKDYKLKESK